MTPGEFWLRMLATSALVMLLFKIAFDTYAKDLDSRIKGSTFYSVATILLVSVGVVSSAMTVLSLFMLIWKA